MKKKLAFLATSAYLLASQPVFAQTASVEKINIGQAQGGRGIASGTPINTIVQNAITIVFTIAALAVLIFLIYGAFQWITSGGEKEKVAKARGAIVNALIGLALLGLAFLIVRVVGQLVGFNILTQFDLPSLGNPVTATPAP